MIDVKQAVNAAINYLRELPNTSDRVGRLLLEEVELVEEQSWTYWRITLSLPSADAAFEMVKIPRDYKVFTIDAETGEIRSMKIRQLNAA